MTIPRAAVRDLGSADELRLSVAKRLRGERPPTERAVAEAIWRLEPSSSRARLELLATIDGPEPRAERWWGFYEPGSNDDVALHASAYARTAPEEGIQQLGALPNVARWMKRRGLTIDMLQQLGPVLPATGLWSFAGYLENTGESTAFSYFCFACSPRQPRRTFGGDPPR